MGNWAFNRRDQRSVHPLPDQLVMVQEQPDRICREYRTVSWPALLRSAKRHLLQVRRWRLAPITLWFAGRPVVRGVDQGSPRRQVDRGWLQGRKLKSHFAVETA